MFSIQLIQLDLPVLLAEKWSKYSVTNEDENYVTKKAATLNH